MLAYPIQISNTGGLSLSTDPERDKIMALLDCRYWERVMSPDFGNPIDLFDPLGAGDTGDITSRLSLALSYWVGDQITVSIQDDPSGIEQGVIQLEITYGAGTGLIQYTIDRPSQLLSA